MGLASRLGYQPGDQNLIQRWVIALASTRLVSAIARRILPSLDRFALRMTGGKSTVTSVTSGFPVLWLTTRGAKTGADRTVPLIGFPLDDDLAILGTHFGHETTPGWVHNLRANADARVAFRGLAIPGTRPPGRPSRGVGDLGSGCHRLSRVSALCRPGISSFDPGVCPGAIGD